jgi:uncharacterized protein (UPF0218 family)
MVVFPPGIRRELKKPLGRLVKDFRRLKALGRTRRIISVGDVCTLVLLGMGIKPHLAVFDHLFMRHELDRSRIGILERSFRKPARYKNPQGTLSERIIADSGRLVSKGGGVLIDGEEDLTALAFIMAAGPGDAVVYGQPGKGMVVVLPDRKIKKKIERWLSAAASFGHEVKGHVGEKG